MAGPGLNKVTLIGNLGADPERRRTQSGVAVANLNLATTESWFDNETKERKDRTEWHRVVFFGNPAETILQHLQKGRRVYIEGRLQTRKWQDQSGQDRYTTEVVGREFIFLDRLESAGRPSAGESGSYSSRQPAETPAPASSMDDDLDVDVPW